MVKIKTTELKTILSKVNVAIEKNVFNPQSGWVQIGIGKDGNTSIQISNFDYYINVAFKTENEGGEELNAVVEAETFVPLISKISNEYIELDVNDVALTLKTKNNLYTFPLQIDMATGKVGNVDTIDFNSTNCSVAVVDGSDISSIASINAKGIGDNSACKKIIQQFVYVDNNGAETFTDNIYINPFKENDSEFKFLLNKTQSKILSIFDSFKEVEVRVEEAKDDETKYKANLCAKNDTSEVSVVFITQNKKLTEQFPSKKLRDIVNKTTDTHVIVDRDELNRALARLMVFDKKFGANVWDYSKIEWGENECKLVSTKSKNYEIIPYIRSENAFKHESVIRFADLVEQLKAFTSKEIDMSYGGTPVIIINADELKQLIPEVVQV